MKKTNKTLKYSTIDHSNKGIVVIEPNPNNIVGVITFNEISGKKNGKD